jgi:DNA-binding CsgD family transcriptional regulator
MIDFDDDRYVMHGRDAELAIVENLVTQARAGRGSALVVRGHAGIGKSTLLKAAGRCAAEAAMSVLSANGAEAESALPFAALHQLIAPLLDSLPAVEPALRQSLAAAFGPEDARPGAFTAGMAVLELLRHAAAGNPMLLLVEDAHRLDPETIDVLVFVARRIATEPIAVLMAVRTQRSDVLAGAGLSELRLYELDGSAARLVLDDRAPGMAPARRERILAEAAGHPLALVELPRCVPSGTSDELPPALPLNERLQAAFADRFRRLPEQTRAVVAALSADAGCGLSTVAAAARALTGGAVGPEHIQPALDAGVLEIQERRLRFRHPLVRSAAYHGLPVADRLTIHAALADAFTADPDRRAWHRSAATLGPDEQVSHDVEQAAGRALRRGAPAVAVVNLERAADLTDDSARRTSLLLRAAEFAAQLDDRGAATRLAARAEPARADAADRARLALVSDVVEPGDLRDVTRVEALCELSAQAHGAGETALAAALCWRAASRCWWAGLPPEVGARVAAAHRGLGFPGDDPRSLAITAYAQPGTLGAEILRELPSLVPDRTDIDGMHFLGAAAMVLGDFVTAASFLGTAAAGFRAQGRTALLARSLSSTGFLRLWLGRWPSARADLDEVETFADATGEPFWRVAARVGQAMHEALRGDSDTAARLAGEVLSSPLTAGARSVVAAAQHARGIAANVAGRHDEAFDLLSRMFDPDGAGHHPDVSGWALPDLADAAVRAGRRHEIQEIIAAARDRAARLPSPMLHRSLAYAVAVLAPDEDAGDAFEQARAVDLAAWPVHRARLDLAYGTWLRRRKRIRESRVPLRAARDGFDALGAQAWGRLAREELRAAGEEDTSGTPADAGQLTAQELQTAELAAAGLSNREIGQRLFLSHRTVSSHLYRIFPKLGISGRSQLRAALANLRQGAD